MENNPKKFRQIDSFHLTSFFGLLAHCEMTEITGGKNT